MKPLPSRQARPAQDSARARELFFLNLLILAVLVTLLIFTAL